MARNGNIRLSGVEALRGAAATAVVLSHAARHVDHALGAPALITAFQAGHAGVDLFFVISGFIILFVHRADIGRPARTAHYLGRRFNRVFPLYWVALALTLLMTLASGHPSPGPGRLLASALLLPVPEFPLLDIAWTLQFEIVFYAAFTVLILRASLGWALLAAWLALCLAAAADVPLGLRAPLADAYGMEFFFGMAAAALLRRGRVPAPGALAVLGLCLFAATLAAESAGLVNGFAHWARLAYGLPAALLVLGLAAREQASPLPVPRWLTLLGGASYSIYLFQFVFIGILWQALLTTHLAARLPHALLFVLLAAAALLGGVLTSLVVEKPLLRALRRHPALQPRPIPP